MSDDSLAMILKIIRLAALFAFGWIRASPECTMTPSVLGMCGAVGQGLIQRCFDSRRMVMKDVVNALKGMRGKGD